MTAHEFPYGDRRLRDVVKADLRANPRDPGSQALLVALRASQYMIGRFGRRNPLTQVAVAADRLFSEVVFNVELRPATHVGPGLTLYHRTGLVVNDHAVIGSQVTLRHNVTIGHQSPQGRSPRLGDGVEVGAGAIIVGDIEIGKGSKVGAGAVVIRDVQPGQTVVGNPAKPINRS